MSVITAFGVACVLLWFLRRVAFHIGLVDHPGGHRAHEVATPLIGGLAMFLAFSFAALTMNVPIGALRALFAGSALLVVVGVLDDLHELSTRARFVAQIAASLLMTLWGGVVVADLGAIGWNGGIAVLGTFAIPFTVFAAVGVINAVNMADGIDGLAGSVALVAVVSMGLLSWSAGQLAALAILGALAAVLAAFLFFNLPFRGRARLFMGDAGSLFLGFVLSWYLISLSQGDQRAMTPVTALWIVAVPLVDAVSMMVRRIFKGQSPFNADREHFHHVLQSAGFSAGQTLGIIIAVQVVAAAIGVGGYLLSVPEYLMFFGFLAFFLLHLWLVMHAWRFMRFLKRSLAQSYSR